MIEDDDDLGAGSVEGWAPTTFKSSRKDRARKRTQPQSIQDFMDEEDELHIRPLKQPMAKSASVSKKPAADEDENKSSLVYRPSNALARHLQLPLMPDKLSPVPIPASQHDRIPDASNYTMDEMKFDVQRAGYVPTTYPLPKLPADYVPLHKPIATSVQSGRTRVEVPKLATQEAEAAISGFIPYKASNPQKADRYTLYLKSQLAQVSEQELLDEMVRVYTLYTDDKEGSHSSMEESIRRELMEFQKAAKALQSIHGASLSSRFASSSTQKPLAGPQFVPSSTHSAPTQKTPEEFAEIEVKMTATKWVPHPILCQKFNIANPYPSELPSDISGQDASLELDSVRDRLLGNYVKLERAERDRRLEAARTETQQPAGQVDLFKSIFGEK